MTTSGIDPLLRTLAQTPERFPAALLLTASSEARLEDASRALAARLLCPGERGVCPGESEGDASCGSCRRAGAGLHPDFLSIEPEGVQIRVDRIREALIFAAGRPYEGPLRVARILRADLLGLEAANALLKSLEEPGERFRWILTSSRPDSLLPTIRSRCTRVALPEPSTAERQREWQSRGYSEEDARDLVRFLREDAANPVSELEEARETRQRILSALEEGLAAGRLPSLLLLAEQLGFGGGDRESRLLAELLADAALASETPQSEAIRHHSVAGRLAQLSRRVSSSSLREAAAAAADPPPDSRRGNRRLHYEKLLLGLWESQKAMAVGGRG